MSDEGSSGDESQGEQPNRDISIEALFDTVLDEHDANKMKERFRTDESLTFVDYSFLSQENIGNEDTRAILVHRIYKRLQEKKVVKYKVFNDPVHGSIQVHPLAVCIIDTPLFQRLRYLKQLGAVPHVYPGGTHTRFEHSIGVYHLAGKVVNALKKNQPELNITPFESMCVQIVGLCHDLGHGPFSHLFEDVVKEVRRQEEVRRQWQAGENDAEAEEWTHELQSVKIMNHLFTQDLNVKKAFEHWGFQRADLERIKDMVLGKVIASPEPDDGVLSDVEQFRKDKGFLYEIVCNKESGLDVDKWDYFARDSYHLGMTPSFDHNRLIFHLKVLEDEKEESYNICVRNKEKHIINRMFAVRYDLHKTVYKHPVTHGVQIMIEEALVSAAPYLKFAGKSLLEALDDMEAYTKLHDGIYHMILNDTGDDLGDAKELLERIERRDLWKCVGPFVTDPNQSEPELDKLTRKLNDKVTSDPKDSLKLSWAIKDYGSRDKDPLDKIRFFDKGGKLVPEKRKLPTAPHHYLSKVLRVYWTGPKEELNDEVREQIQSALGSDNDLQLVDDTHE